MLKQPKIDIIETDVLVLGGGLPGVCAAVASARQGVKTVLVEKSLSLGGNCGPELGVHPSDAARFHSYMSSTGIVGEIMEEAAFRNACTDSPDHHYNISTMFSSVMMDYLKRAGVIVLLGVYAHTPDVENGKIKAVICEDTANYHRIEIRVNGAVIDDTGDGNVSNLAGASWRMGREAKSEYNERSAPEKADSITMGSSLVAYIRNTGHPVEFVPPDNIPPYHKGYWDVTGGFNNEESVRFFFPIETGGDIDTIEDEHEIYERTLLQFYSAWNEIKNVRFKKEAENYDIVWISPRIGKRETRRFLGDYVVTQTDVEAGRDYEDGIAIGGFALDIHHPRQDDAKYVHVDFYSIPPLYAIPYRSIYSKDVTNLFFASRLLSVSHMAHGTVRLQRTLATIGQAAGTAAALCYKKGYTNRQLFENGCADELRQELLKNDASILNQVKNDLQDLTRTCKVSATSEEKLLPNEKAEFNKNTCGLELWMFPETIEKLFMKFKNTSDKEEKVGVKVLHYTPSRPWQTRDEYPFLPEECESGITDWTRGHNEAEWGNDNRLSEFSILYEGELVLAPHFEGKKEIVKNLFVGKKNQLTDGDRVTILFEKNENVEIASSKVKQDYCREVVEIGEAEYKTILALPYFEITPTFLLGECEQAVCGYPRRFSNMPLNMWRPTILPADLHLTWDNEITAKEIAITFDTLSRIFIYMPYEHAKKASPQVPKIFTLTFLKEGKIVKEFAENNWYHRVYRKDFEVINFDEIVLHIEKTWEDKLPGVYDIRIY